MRVECDVCGRSYANVRNLNRHKREVHERNGVRGRHTCRRCGRNFASRARVGDHVCFERRRERPRVLVRDPAFDDSTPIPPQIDPPELHELYRLNWSSIRSSRYIRRFQDILNCRLLRLPGDSEPEAPVDTLRRLWRAFDCALKINISYGVVLRHSVTGRLRYFHASSNNATVFPVARTVSSLEDLNRLIENFLEIDPAQMGINRRDGSSWVLHAVTNVTFYLYKLLGVNRVGCSWDIKLPDYILKSR